MTPNADFNNTLDQALNLARNARHVEVFTGAGMSAESGLETYRDDTTGLWENVDPQAMASISAWVKDPDPMWAWYLWRARLAHNAQPNAGHEALARWASISDVLAEVVVLHQLAGRLGDGPGQGGVHRKSPSEVRYGEAVVHGNSDGQNEL